MFTLFFYLNSVPGSSIWELFEKDITVVHGSGVKKAMVPQFNHKHSPAPTQVLTFINNKKKTLPSMKDVSNQAMQEMRVELPDQMWDSNHDGSVQS